MAWLRLYTDILSDPKLMRAARKRARGLKLLPWLLAFAKEADDNWRLTVDGEPAEAEDIASRIPDCRPREVEECAESLLTIGILARDDDGALRFVNGNKRNYIAPSDERESVRERVRKHRQRHRAPHQNETTPVTPLHDDGNDPIPHDRNATRTETETEQSRAEVDAEGAGVVGNEFVDGEDKPTVSKRDGGSWWPDEATRPHIEHFFGRLPDVARRTWEMRVKGWLEGVGFAGGRRADPVDLAAGLLVALEAAELRGAPVSDRHALACVVDAERRRHSSQPLAEAPSIAAGGGAFGRLARAPQSWDEVL